MKKVIWMVVAVLLFSACQSTNKKEKSEADDSDQLYTVELSVSGMYCMGCVETVQASAGQIAGVTEAKASLEDKNAIVQFHSSQTDTTEIRKAIELNGYKVTAIKPAEKE